jgi:thiol-disulfide isomerase/thioredoxin
MKKIFLLLACVACTLTGFGAGDGFTINGKVASVKGGVTAYLVVTRGEARDTIATATVEEGGVFTLTGNVTGLQVAVISFEGMRGGIPVYLENTAYEITSEMGIEIKGGGEAQRVANLFSAAEQETQTKGMELNKAFTEAGAAKDAERMEAIREEYMKLVEAGKEKAKELIAENPSALASLYNVLSFMNGAEYEALNERFNMLGEELRNTTEGKQISDRLAQMETVSVGKIAPDFELDTPEGEKITLHGVQGKVKLIDFWASWCGPCRGENPNVVAMYEEYHPKGLEIIGVSLDRDRDAWIKAIEDDKLTWKHGSDLQYWNAAPAKLYLVNSIPHTVLLDADNRIIAKNLRGKALRDKIAELLD